MIMISEEEVEMSRGQKGRAASREVERKKERDRRKEEANGYRSFDPTITHLTDFRFFSLSELKDSTDGALLLITMR